MKNIWKTLLKPILALAPMEAVTDTVFRRVVASCAKPDIFFTEFTSVDGLLSEGRDVVNQRLKFTEEERPIIAQIWGKDPEKFYQVAKMIVAMGFDGIDVNMGCPDKNVMGHGSCAALILNPPLAQEIIKATKKGVGELPVSVKTRIGYKSIQTEEWIEFLLKQNIDALVIHGRTAKELSKVPAHWDEIGKATTIRNRLNIETVILGNGDVKNYTEAKEKCKTYGLDGIMIGRGVFDNLWVFDKSGKEHKPNQVELFGLMRNHIRLWHETWGTSKNFAILKKFFKIYVSGIDHATNLRMKLMEAADKEQVQKIIASY